MCAFFSFSKLKFGAAYNYFVTMINKMMDQVLQVEHHWSAVYQRDVIYAERSLQRSVFEQVVQYDSRICIAFDLVNYANTFTVRFIAYGRDAFYLFLFNQFRRALYHVRLVDLVRNFGHDDTLTLVV